MFTAVAARRIPRVALPVSRRLMSSGTAGSVSGQKGFKDKESAHENEYARKQEQLELSKLRAELERQKAELESLQQQVQEKAEADKKN